MVLDHMVGEGKEDMIKLFEIREKRTIQVIRGPEFFLLEDSDREYLGIIKAENKEKCCDTCTSYRGLKEALVDNYASRKIRRACLAYHVDGINRDCVCGYWSEKPEELKAAIKEAERNKTKVAWSLHHKRRSKDELLTKNIDDILGIKKEPEKDVLVVKKGQIYEKS